MLSKKHKNKFGLVYSHIFIQMSLVNWDDEQNL